MEDKPWWKSSAFVALLGFAIPAATFLQGWLQKGRELELQDKQQKQELRLAYMNVLVDGGLEGMALVADFAAKTEQDPTIRTWAEALTKDAERRAVEERARLREQQGELVVAEEALGLADEQARQAQAVADAALERAPADREAKQAAERALKEAEAAQKKAARAEEAARVAKERVNRSKETLEGRPDKLVSERHPVSAETMRAVKVQPALFRLLEERPTRD